MDGTFQKLYAALNELTNSISHMNYLLKEDKALFIKNDIKLINRNNSTKQQILQNLSEQAACLQSCLPVDVNSGLATTIKQYLNHLDIQQSTKMTKLLHTLSDKISDGYQMLITNNHLVNQNLEILKDVWDRLQYLTDKNKTTYDKPINTAK